MGSVCRVKSRSPRSAIDDRQCGCEYCAAVRTTGAPPPLVRQHPAPIQHQELGCNCGAAVAGQECGCNQQSQSGYSPTYSQLPGYTQEIPVQSGLVSQDNLVPYQSTEQSGQYLPIAQIFSADQQNPVESVAPPAAAESAEPKLNINSDAGSFESAPELLTEPPPSSEATPYVEPKLETAPPAQPQIDGVAVPELDAETGFLSPQVLSEPADDLSEEGLGDSGFDSILVPTKANSSKPQPQPESDQMVVLKARPVMNHRVNNQGVLRPGDAIATNRTDSYGLPIDSSVHFAELPPVHKGTRPRPVSFERSPEPMPPVKHLQELPPRKPTIEDKSTKVESRGVNVVESTTNQPTDREPMLRMTAIPYPGTSSLGGAIARIKVGKSPLIVRGAYPRDSEYERLARERNEKATGSVIIPSTSLKTIDR